MNTIDLHIHSTHSDGTLTPQKIVELALKEGMRVISVADHDTVTQVKEVAKAAEGADIEVISGVEVSADFTEGTMHILGYGVDPDNDELYEMLQEFRRGRDERNPQIVEKLRELGIDIAYEEVLREAGGVAVGRPHIAQVLLKKKAVKTMKEAFDKYLAKGAPAYFDRIRFSSLKIISAIHNAGGLAFLAHPKQLRIDNKNNLDKLVQKLIDEGLDGIEVYSSCHSKEERKQYLKIAEKYDLLISGGSDYHGIDKDYINMGFVGDGIELDYSVVEKMKARLNS